MTESRTPTYNHCTYLLSICLVFILFRGCQKFTRERMPPRKPGQIYTYPQRHWKKKRYQYLKFFLAPKRSTFDPESEMHTISQIENPTLNEDSNHSMGDHHHTSGGPKEGGVGGMTVKTVRVCLSPVGALFFDRLS